MDETFTFQIWNKISQRCGTDQRQRQLIQSSLTQLQSELPHQLLCPKRWERIKNRNTTETKQLERRDFVDWHRLVLAWCRQDVLSLRDQWVDETSTSLRCSQRHWSYELLSDIWVSLFSSQPCSTIAQSPPHLVIQALIKWLQLIDCYVFITAECRVSEDWNTSVV